MLITNHILAATLVSSHCHQPLSAAAAGLTSHLAMDAIPHWGGEDYLPVARIDGVTGLIVGGLVLATSRRRRILLPAIVGACLPDSELVLQHFFGRGFQPRWFQRLHGAVQTEHTVLAQEIILAAILGSLTWRQRHRW